MSKIVLATESNGFEQRVRRLFGTGAANGQLFRFGGDLRASDVERIVVDLTQEDPEVIAIGPGIAADRAFDVAELIDRDRPEISVVVVVDPHPEMWERALRAGVRDIVAPDATEPELRAVFERATATATRRRTNLVEETTPVVSTGKVLTVMAPKGGSGKTALAVNLAVGLAERAPGRVAIVDLDLLFGDVTNAMLLRPEHSIADAAGAGRLDITMLKVFLTPRAGNLFALCAPESPALGETVSDTAVVRALELLKREFDWVVVDTAAGLTEVTLATLEKTDELLLICDMSVSGVRGMRKVTDALDRLEVPARRHFIVNRADSKVGLTLTDVEATVGMPIDARIPSSRMMPRSMNEGVPIVESAPRSPVSRALYEIVDMFVEAGLEDRESTNGVRRRRRGQ
jgi:pilus assembly protein CpaE